jgi:hypothetical protein
MNIGLHIAELLEQHGKVSVQGVGTFYLKKTDAYFDEDRQMFFPRNRKLSFKLFEEDNSIFPQYISDKEDISGVAANHVIKEFAIKFNNALGTSGSAEIRGIGKLKKEGSEYVIDTFSSYGLLPLPDSGSMFFEIDAPDLGEEITLDNNKTILEEEFNARVEEINARVEEITARQAIREEIAQQVEEVLPQKEVIQEPVLEEIQIPEEIPVKEETPIPEEIPIKEPDPIPEEVPIPKVSEQEEDKFLKETLKETFKGDYDSLFSNIVDTDKPLQDDDEETKLSPLREWLIISFAIVVLAGAVLGYLFYPKIKILIQQYRTGTVQVTPAPVTPASIVPAPVDSLADSLLTKQTDSIIAAAATAPVTKTDSMKNGTGTYEIIVASFALKSEAETYVTQWAAKGQKVHIIERPLRTFKYKVSAGSFTDRAAAQNELSSVQTNINKEAWIDQIKN